MIRGKANVTYSLFNTSLQRDQLDISSDEVGMVDFDFKQLSPFILIVKAYLDTYKEGAAQDCLTFFTEVLCMGGTRNLARL